MCMEMSRVIHMCLLSGELLNEMAIALPEFMKFVIKGRKPAQAQLGVVVGNACGEESSKDYCDVSANEFLVMKEVQQGTHHHWKPKAAAVVQVTIAC